MRRLPGFPLACVASMVLAACAPARAVGGGGDEAEAVGFHYACGRWFARPTAPRVLADLRFTRPPTEEDEAAVRRQGGRVLHRFHAAALRVALPTAAVPRLVDGEVVAAAVGVRDAGRFHLPLVVRYTHPPTAEELARIRALGAEVASPPGRVLLADVAVPSLRALPFVAAVAPDLPFCPGE